jgi:hypothetical protein
MLYFSLFETGRKGVDMGAWVETDNVLNSSVFRLLDPRARDDLCDSRLQCDVCS